ncbi:MAG: hypothetical protein AB1736_03270 [Chloroflexota bacterium]
MIRRPSGRGVSLLATSTLLALMLLVPAGTSAATPGLVQFSYPAPATVAEGELAAVVFGVTNSGKSTVSQLFLDDVFYDGGTFLKAYPSQGSCTADGTSCTFGQLKPKKSASVILVITPTSAAVSVTGTFNTTGLGSGSDDASHGDQWDVAASVSVSSDTQDVGGRFIDLDGNLLVQNSQELSDTNPHSTRVVAPQTLIGVSVEDGTVVVQCGEEGYPACPSGTLFGETSIIHVAQGGAFPDGFQVVIGFDRSEIVGANANSLTIYHTYGDGESEVIDTKCSFAKGSSTPKSLPCLTVENIGGGDLQATIWTTHNGVMRGLG